MLAFNPLPFLLMLNTVWTLDWCGRRQGGRRGERRGKGSLGGALGGRKGGGVKTDIGYSGRRWP